MASASTRRALASAAPAREKLLTEEQLAEYLGESIKTTRKRRYRGDGPPVVKLSARALRYRPSAVEQWLTERTAAR